MFQYRFLVRLLPPIGHVKKSGLRTHARTSTLAMGRVSCTASQRKVPLLRVQKSQMMGMSLNISSLKCSLGLQETTW